MHAVQVDTEFQSLMPALSQDEREALERNLLADGCRDPLVVWDGVLVDGHNRLEICTQHAIPYTTVAKQFASRTEAVAWIISNQLGRRNLTAENVVYLRGMRYEEEKKEQGGQLGNANAKNEHESLSGSFETAERLATEYGVTARTIHNDADFARDVNTISAIAPGAKNVILSGKSTRAEVKQLAGMDVEELRLKLADLETRKVKPRLESRTETGKKRFISGNALTPLDHLIQWWKGAEPTYRDKFLAWLTRCPDEWLVGWHLERQDGSVE